MEDDRNIQASDQANETTKRPLLISITCIFSFVYNAIILLSLLFAGFFPRTISNILNQYHDQINLGPFWFYVFLVLGIFVFGLAFYSILLLWKMKRKGILFFLISQLVIIGLLSLFSPIDLFKVLSVSLFLLIFWSYRNKMRS
jgi:hypothetical protein